MATACVAALSPAAAQAADTASSTQARAKDRPAAGWTRTLNVRLTPRRLDLPAETSPRRLARAALQRHARRLGLAPSLPGVRFAREHNLPVGPAGAAKLRSLRYQQTVGGVRVVWSKLDVAVTSRGVRSISATVVPVGRDGLRRGGRVNGSRAVAIARRRVRGRERTLSPQLVVYAGKPTIRKVRPREPRLAWVVEATSARELGEHSPIPLCVVIDAQTGKIIATWKGHVARPARSRSATAAPARASAGDGDEVRTILVYDAHGASLGTPAAGELHQGWRINGNPFVLANWPAADHRTFTGTFNPALDALNSNMGKVVKHMCFTRYFCSRNGARDGTWEPFLATGNAAFSFSGAVYLPGSRVAFSADTGHADDIVAHELGHLMDDVYSDDRIVDTAQANELQEALADMFAYDYDREDATHGEDAGPPRLNLADPGAVRNVIENKPHPALMSQYRCNARDEHFNSTILSHAYYRFVQKVGHPVAGYVLHNVPFALPPRPTFGDVKNAFSVRAAAIYPNNPAVAAAVSRAFVDEVGIGRDDPRCSKPRLEGRPGPVPPTELPTPE